MDGSPAMDSALERAAALYRHGQIGGARVMLAAPIGVLEHIEAARFALHAGDYAAAADLSARAASIASATAAQVLLGRLMHACALQLQGHAASVTFELSDVPTGDPLLGELLYYRALLAFYQRDFSFAESYLQMHTPSAPALRARYLILRGLAAGATERYDTQAALTTTAIDLLQREAPEDVTLLAGAAQILAALARELPLAQTRTLRAICDSLPWTEDLRTARFHVLRTLAWADALHGEYFNAMMLLRRAEPLAGESPILRLYAHIDHGAVALFARNELTAKTELALANEVAERIDWSTVRDDSLVLLPFVATLAAEIDRQKAQAYCEIALSTEQNMQARWAHAHGKRRRAFIDEAVAIAYAEHDPKRAIAAAQAAYDVFASISHDWRAARMALQLLRLTGKAQWRDVAHEHLDAYPNGPFTRLLSLLASSSISLTPRQHQILRLLTDRKSISEIAALLAMSPNTVRVHIGKIHRAFGVRTRADLLRKVQASA